MILKSLSRKSNPAQLLRYVLRYILDDEKTDASHLIRHNIKSRDLAGYIKEFKENESRRIHHRKNNVLLNHIIMSWSTQDAEQVTPAKVKAMAKQLENFGILYPML